MKDTNRIINALGEHYKQVELITNADCVYGVLIDFVSEENVKKKDLLKWLKDYYSEWLNHLVDQEIMSEQEKEIKLIEFDNV